MNRLYAPSATSLDERHRAESLPDVAAAGYSVDRRRSPLAMFGPLHYEPGYAYPLIVWLHGPGDDETQLKRVMPLLSMRNFVAVAPRGPTRQGTPDGYCGYTWPAVDEDTSTAAKRIWAGIAAASRRYHVHPRRTFLAGFDTGGTLAFRLAMDHPERFAGVISLGGAFPGGGAPLARLKEVRALPVFLAAGQDSGRYSSQHVCGDVRLFHTAGMEVTLRQYPCGQQITLAMLADVNRWVMEQVVRSKPL